MKIGITLLFVLLAVEAKSDGAKFNQALRDNIHQVIKENPEKYETKSFGRFPASATPVEFDEDDSAKQNTESMKVRYLQQGVGLPKW